MSDTPRTDAFVDTLRDEAYGDRSRFINMQGHARSLEREYNELIQELRELADGCCYEGPRIGRLTRKIEGKIEAFNYVSWKLRDLLSRFSR